MYYEIDTDENVSYSLQVPLGPLETKAREGAENRLPMAADKGPFYYSDQTPYRGQRQPTPNDSPRQWRFGNSPNHGGFGSGEGQNVLFSDGHASFKKTPIVGIDRDNSHTLMREDASENGRWDGSLPGVSNPNSPSPAHLPFAPAL